MATIAQDNIIIRFIAETGKFERDRQRVFRETERQVRQIENGVGGGLQAVDQQAGKVQGRFSRIADAATGFLSANLISAAANALGGLVSKSFELSKNYEQSLISFEVLTGSMENAERLLERLDRFSLETPFEPTQINEAAKTLLGFGRGLDEVEDDIRLIGNAAAATSSDLGNLALVFGQVAGVGKLQGQDALQLINAGIPVYQLLAESLGVSVGKVKELQSAGQITFDVLRDAFEKATEAGGKFEGALLKQSQSMAGLLSTAQGAFDTILRLAGDAFLPIAKQLLPPIIDLLFQFVDVVKTAGPLVSGLLSSAFQAFQQAVAPVVRSVTDLMGAFSAGEGPLQRVADYMTLITRYVAIASRVFANFIDVINLVASAFGGGDKFISGYIDLILEIPKVLGGVISVFEQLPDVVAVAFRKAKLNVQAFIQDLVQAFDLDKIRQVISGKIDVSDLFRGGDGLRQQAEGLKGLAIGVKDAFKLGYRRIENIEVKLPAIDTEANKASAEGQGKALGKKVAEGIDKGIKEGLPEAGSLEAIRKQVATVQGIIDNIGDTGTGGMDRLNEAVKDLVAQERNLKILEATIEGIRKAQGPQVVELLPGTQGDEAIKNLVASAKASLEGFSALDFLPKVEEYLDERAKLEAKANRRRRQQQIAEAKEAAVQTLGIARDLTAQVIQVRVDELDREISIQQDRLDFIVSIAERGNAEQVELERERLRKIQSEREQAVQRQQQLAALEITINNAIAASKAIVAIADAFAVGNIPLGIATAASLALTIASTVLTVSQAFGGLPAFREGTESFDPAKPTPDGGGLVILHRNERVLTAEQNAPLLRLGVKNEQIPALVEAGLGNLASPLRVVDTGVTDRERRLALRVRELEQEQQKRERSKGPDVDVDVIFDEYGMRIVTERQLRAAQRRRRLRRG